MSRDAQPSYQCRPDSGEHEFPSSRDRHVAQMRSRGRSTFSSDLRDANPAPSRISVYSRRTQPAQHWAFGLDPDRESHAGWFAGRRRSSRHTAITAPKQSRLLGPLLLQVFGICEVGLGIFVVDPARSPASMTLHGTLHIVFGAIGFLTLMAACFVFARSFHVQRKKAWAIFCRMVGLMFLAAFLSAGRTARLGQDTSSIQLFLNLVFCLEWIWVSSISLRYYQQHLSDPSARETLAQTSGKFGRSASSRDDTTAGRN